MHLNKFEKSKEEFSLFLFSVHHYSALSKILHSAKSTTRAMHAKKDFERKQKNAQYLKTFTGDFLKTF